MVGACHAKVMYMYPYLLVGSTNWSVSSEANKVFSAVLEIDDQETRDYVEKTLNGMKTGAAQMSANSFAGMRQNERRAGCRSRKTELPAAEPGGPPPHVRMECRQSPPRRRVSIGPCCLPVTPDPRVFLDTPVSLCSLPDRARSYF